VDLISNNYKTFNFSRKICEKPPLNQTHCESITSKLFNIAYPSMLIFKARDVKPKSYKYGLTVHYVDSINFCGFNEATTRLGWEI